MIGGVGLGCLRHLGLAFFQIFDALFLFPKHILDLLIIIEQAIDADVGVMVDGVTGLVVELGIAGGVVMKAVEGDIFVQQDGIQGDHLFLGKVDEPFLDRFEFMDSLLCRLGLMRWVRGSVGGAAGLTMRG